MNCQFCNKDYSKGLNLIANGHQETDEKGITIPLDVNTKDYNYMGLDYDMCLDCFEVILGVVSSLTNSLRQW